MIIDKTWLRLILPTGANIFKAGLALTTESSGEYSNGCYFLSMKSRLLRVSPSVFKDLVYSIEQLVNPIEQLVNPKEQLEMVFSSHTKTDEDTLNLTAGSGPFWDQ